MEKKIGLIGDSLTEGRPGVSFSKLLIERYPSITFENHGKPGETIKSLYTRLSKTNLAGHYDLLFLWIGVNDVYSKLLKVKAQPIADIPEEFKLYFQKVLDLLIPNATNIVVVSPGCVSENLTNASNQELKILSTIMQSVAAKYPSVQFLDMQSVFQNKLSNISSSDYISTDVFTVMKDVFLYKKPSRIDRLSSKRGLHLTLDGIHLNSQGALVVADQYSAMIEQILLSAQESNHD